MKKGIREGERGVGGDGIGLPLVKSLRSIAQSLGSQLRL